MKCNAPSSSTSKNWSRLFKYLGLAVITIGILTWTACGGDDREPANEGDQGKSSTQYVEMGDDYGLTTEIRGDRSLTRTWIRPEIEKVASLSEGKTYTLFNPRLAQAVSEEGHLFVYDFGDYTVKAFTREGEYVATYGRGEGRGPGELTMMSDMGVWRDSLVYLVDPRQRRVSFFEKDGDFVKVETYEAPIVGLTWSGDLTKYMERLHPATSTFLSITTPSGHKAAISQLLSGDSPRIILDGSLHTSQGRAIYVMRYFPAILMFSPDDTTGVAYPTPDYGQPRPKVRTRNEGRAQQVFAPSTRIHEKSTIHDGVLSVEVPDPEVDSLQFDLYDAREMEYMYSIQLPAEVEGGDRPFGALYAHGMDLVATVDEATVNLYEMQNSE